MLKDYSNDEICFHCDIREDCEHVGTPYLFNMDCTRSIVKEMDCEFVAQIAYDKLFDRFRGRR